MVLNRYMSMKPQRGASAEPPPVPAPVAVAVRAKAIADATAAYCRGRQFLVSLGEQHPEHGGAPYEVFAISNLYGHSNRYLHRYSTDPGVLHPQFDNTPHEPPSEKFTMPTAQAFFNRDAVTRPDPPPEPIAGIGTVTRPDW